MNFNDLSKFIFNKYGLRFKPAVPGNTNMYVLASPVTGDYFAIMSRIKQGNRYIATLDLCCGAFAQMIRDLPGFSTPFRLNSPEWVGILLAKVSRESIESAFDYAFKLAMNENDGQVIDKQPFIYIPQDDIDPKYQTQKIKPQEKKRQEINSTVPIEIKKMQESYDYSVLPSMGREKNFYLQGMQMANYEQEYSSPAVFKRFYPTYHDMTTQQLQTYFAWRTKIRNGKYEKTSTSYVFVYIYELLNKIGVNSSAEGLEKLIFFENNYANKYDLSVVPYLRAWIKDYTVYYNLKNERENIFQEELEEDKNYAILLNPDDFSSKELLAAFSNLSTYMNKCQTYKKMPVEFPKILYQIWRETSQQTKIKSFFNKYIAQRNVSRINLFNSAVFYKRENTNVDYAIDSLRKYTFQDGAWFLMRYIPLKGQRVALNNYLHEVDRICRIKFNIGRKIKPRKLEYEYLETISRGIDNYLKVKQAEKVKKIKIDFSNLDQIRQDASKTRESLLTDEERELEQAENEAVNNTQKSENTKEPIIESKNEFDLSMDEQFLLLALLKNEDYRPYLKKHNLMASILVDQINEKLFDEIGDSVIEFNDQDQPEIIEDYLEDLQEIFLKGE